MKEKNRNLKSLRIDALPVLNRYIKDCRLADIINQCVPSVSGMKIPHHDILLLLLRNIMISCFPLYKISEWSENYIPELIGISEKHLEFLNDDRIGRSLDKLFLADRSTLCTMIVLEVIKKYRIQMKTCHNDSTSVTFSGNYHRKQKFGKKAKEITNGFNKDHRPDLKQLVFNLVVSNDGAVPIHFKLYDGNVTDDTTHIEIWNDLKELIGHSNFIYVADSKLCTKNNMNNIAGKTGKFITVLPKTRKEYKVFMKRIEEQSIRGKALWYREAFPRKASLKNRYRGYESSKFRSGEGYRIIWIHSSQKQKLDDQNRRQKIQKVEYQLQEVSSKINTYSLKKKGDLRRCVNAILKETKMTEVFNYEIKSFQKYFKKQVTRGRPGPNTSYRTTSKTYHQLKWSLRKDILKKKANTDGFFPLITNIDDLDMRTILKHYKYQPYLEKRHSYLKSVLEVAPVFLKTPERIEALLFLYYLSLMTYALIERDMQLAMKKEKIKSIPIYPEQRECNKPSAERILEILQNISRHELWEKNSLEETFFVSLNTIQSKVLELLKIKSSFYCQ